MNLALPTLLTAALLGQTPAHDNLDLIQGLAGWEGSGFAAVAAAGERSAGAWSKDDGNVRKGMLRFVLTIPRGARRLQFQAYAEVSGQSNPDHRLAVVLAGADNIPLTRLRLSSSGTWDPAPLIDMPWLGKPRTYAWDVSGHQGERMQVVLVDQDDRPGHHVFAGGFKLVSGDAVAETGAEADFAAFMLNLQKSNNLVPMARYDSKRFMAISNADERFTTERLQYCEIFYDHFIGHFRAKGFEVHAPKDRLMIAVFDNHPGFDAYFGHKMPNGVAGVYHTATNRLVVYDFAENRGILATKEAARRRGSAIFDRAQQTRFVDTAERQIGDFARDANLSTTMHECAHLISFNCGLLNRKASVPGWLAEGLATYCEATDNGDWTVLGDVNPMRISTLHRGRGAHIPLTELLRGEEWIRSQHVLLGYAQSWALFHMLIRERPQDLRRYLNLIKDRMAPEGRLADFQQAFGDITTVERRHQTYLNELMARVRPTAQR